MDEAADDDFYIPDECWELVFKFLIKYDGQENNYNYDCFQSLSLVSKQFLSITNRLRYSLTIRLLAEHFLPSLCRRFPNLTSLNLLNPCPDNLLCKISTFSLNLTSLHLTYLHTFPTNGLRAFSQNITTLTSLTCSIIGFLPITDNDMFLIADCFPNLKKFELKHCYDLCEGIAHVLRRCSNIRYLNLAHCIGLNLSEMNFELPKLKVLNLTFTRVDDETLYVISKNCHRLLELLLNHCNYITEIGVKHVAENCTQLREINLSDCQSVHANVVVSMISSRPSLKKITAPPRFRLGKRNKPFKCRGCLVCFC